MKHNWLRLFDHNGVWIGNEDHTIRVNGETHDVFEYAEKHGIKIPITQPQVNSYADMEQAFDSRDIDQSGDGDSESTE